MSFTAIATSHKHLLLGTALVGAFAAGYGRRAYAGSCVVSSPGVFTCSGPAGADTTQALTGAPLTVTTTPGFGITIAVDTAFTLGGTGGLTFTDVNGSTITGAGYGIYGRNTGGGALSITSTGVVTGGGSGIYVRNYGAGLTIAANTVTGSDYRGISAISINGSGALSITATGLVTGTRGYGIYARNATNGTDLTIAVGAVTGRSGIRAGNNGRGVLSITATGPVTGTTDFGIYAVNSSFRGSGMVISAVDVRGGFTGIQVNNSGPGAQSITSTGTVTGTGYNGMLVRNYGTSSTISVANVDGGKNGIYTRNSGSGALSITSIGAVAGNSQDGINAQNFGTSLTIHAVDVSGGRNGAFALSRGIGVLAVTTTGQVSGGAAGILTSNQFGDTVIEAANVRGGTSGIYANAYGTGVLSITTTGAVVGTAQYGIYAKNYDSSTTINVRAGSAAGGRAGIRGLSFSGQPIGIANAGTIKNLSGASADLAITATNGPTSIANTGLVLGTVTLGDLDDSFSNSGTWNTANGANDFGAGTDVVTNFGTTIAANDPAVAEVTQFVGLESFINSGLITLHDGAVGDRVVFTGALIGRGGAIGLDTYIGGDGAPSDLVVIDGGTADPNLLDIANAGGAGALTTANGILVVDAINNGTTTGDAFALAHPVVAGPYDYLLYRSSVDGTGPENWYLRNTLPPQPPEPPIPILRPEVSLAVANPALALFYGRSLLDTLHERIGDRARNAGEIDISTTDEQNGSNEVWGRVIGVTGQHRGDPIGVYGSGPSFDYGLAALQAGTDLYRFENIDENGNVTTDTAGVYGAVGRGSAKVEHHLLSLGDFPGGNVSLNAFTLGGYWTRYGPGNWYLDAVVQGTFYGFENDSRRGLRTSETGGFGLAASLEGGYPLSIGEGFILEPQAQAIFQTIALNNFTDAGADIRYSDANALTGRIGVRLAKSLKDANSATDAHPMTLWGTANLWHEFLASPTTEFSSAAGFIPFTADLRRTWVELGVGADLELDKKTAFYGQVNYQTDFAGETTAWKGQVGLRGKW